LFFDKLAKTKTDFDKNGKKSGQNGKKVVKMAKKWYF